MKLVDHKEFLRISTDTQFEAPGATTIMQELEMGITAPTAARASERRQALSTTFTPVFVAVLALGAAATLLSLLLSVPRLLAAIF